MRRLLIALLYLPFLTHAAADPSLAGVWRGKLGNAEIVACFNKVDGGEASGSYYYARYKKPIQLKTEAGQVGWKEGGDTGAWALEPPAGDKLLGSWRNPKGGKPQALALTRVSWNGEGNACGSDAYNLELEVFPALQVGKVQEFEGKKYRTLRIADVVTLELLEPGDRLARLNRTLRAELPGKQEDIADYFATRRRFFGDMGLAAEDETRTEPVFWSARWITINFYRWAAGYGRNGITLDYRTWDLQSGEEINLWQWFIAKPDDDRNSYPLPDKLKKSLFKNLELDKECKNGYKGEGDYRVSLKNDGMQFWEEAYGTGCEQDFLVPYAKLGPYLTPQGKAALRDKLVR